MNSIRLPRRVYRGPIRVTGNGIIRAPLLKYGRDGRPHEVVSARHSNGIHKIHILHPLLRHRSIGYGMKRRRRR